MFKNIIAPVQAWLMTQGKCVGCGRVLVKKKAAKPVRITCQCGRIYIYDSASEYFRRATLDEVKK